MEDKLLVRDMMLLKIHKKLDFLIWKYAGYISRCPEPQLLLEAFQRDLDELKSAVSIGGKDGE